MPGAVAAMAQLAAHLGRPKRALIKKAIQISGMGVGQGFQKPLFQNNATIRSVQRSVQYGCGDRVIMINLPEARRLPMVFCRIAMEK